MKKYMYHIDLLNIERDEYIKDVVVIASPGLVYLLIGEIISIYPPDKFTIYLRHKNTSLPIQVHDDNSVSIPTLLSK